MLPRAQVLYILQRCYIQRKKGFLFTQDQAKYFRVQRYLAQFDFKVYVWRGVFCPASRDR